VLPAFAVRCSSASLTPHLLTPDAIVSPLQLYDKAVQSGGVIDVTRLLAESQKPWAVDDYQYQFQGAQVQSIVVSASANAQSDASNDCDLGVSTGSGERTAADLRCRPFTMTPASRQCCCSWC
jgi:hypothetical protein